MILALLVIGIAIHNFRVISRIQSGIDRKVGVIGIVVIEWGLILILTYFILAKL